MIDPFHLEAYNETTANYNRDVEIFPVLESTFKKIMSTCPYKSPTDMGVNMAGNAIIDDEACKEASKTRKLFVVIIKQNLILNVVLLINQLFLKSKPS